MNGKHQTHLSVRQLSIHAGQQTLVGNITLHIPAGGVLTLLGESGSGKSLLAQAIMGNLPASLRCTGAVDIGAQQFDAADLHARRKLWGRTLSLLPQEPWLALDPTMRVARQIGEVHELVLGRSEDQATTAANTALARLNMADAGAKYPFQISGGMAQRVAFLATHAAGAPVLIIDEPTKGLDSERRADVLAMLRAAIDDGVTLLTITHDVWLARQLGGAIAVMHNGVLIEQGDAALLDAPQHAYTRSLLAAEPAAWQPQVKAEAQAKTKARLAPLPPVVQVDNISKRFGAQQLFADVSMEIQQGEFVAITGPSGSGKTTLGNIVLGLQKADSGSVRRAGGLARTAFQKIYQDPAAAFAPTVTLRRSLQDLVELHRLSWTELAALMERLRLPTALLDRLPEQVSGGELQRFAIARVLMLKPALIFADEPTSRLDPLTQQETLFLLREHARQHRCAVLLVTHDPDIAARLAQRQIRLPRLLSQSGAAS